MEKEFRFCFDFFYSSDYNRFLLKLRWKGFKLLIKSITEGGQENSLMTWHIRRPNGFRIILLSGERFQSQDIRLKSIVVDFLCLRKGFFLVNNENFLFGELSRKSPQKHLVCSNRNSTENSRSCFPLETHKKCSKIVWNLRWFIEKQFQHNFFIIFSGWWAWAALAQKQDQPDCMTFARWSWVISINYWYSKFLCCWSLKKTLHLLSSESCVEINKHLSSLSQFISIKC